MRHEANLVESALRLRSHAPEAWDEFLNVLDAYTAYAADACVSAPLSELPVAQGRAQSIRALARTLRTAPQTAERSKK